MLKFETELDKRVWVAINTMRHLPFIDMYKVMEMTGVNAFYTEFIPILNRLKEKGLLDWSVSPSWIYLNEIHD